ASRVEPVVLSAEVEGEGPSLAELGGLAGQSRAAGVVVELSVQEADGAEGAVGGRYAGGVEEKGYRVEQEGEGSSAKDVVRGRAGLGASGEGVRGGCGWGWFGCGGGGSLTALRAVSSGGGAGGGRSWGSGRW